MSDLEESIIHQRAALSLWSMDHPIRPSSLSNLGNALRTRFNHLGDMADLDKSIRHYRGALSLHPKDHIDRPDCLNNLSSALELRFNQRGDNIDFEERIRLSQEVLSLTMGRADDPSRFNDVNSALPLKKASTQSTAPTAEAKLRESSRGKLSSVLSTGTTARGQRKTADANTTSEQRRSETDSSEETDSDSV
ncbi:hypothetical protein FRB95_013177 [Tulasnella sp. JGI-2019a]|nr:hypothetical protein FRB95_013177 [Tulasnella sp. JGI-2019a]